MRLGIIFACMAITALAVNRAHAETWGCYDPKPGHPTAAERAAFIDEVSRLAVDAERQHGVPAAAIAAMAMVESGYGWTRTAIDANNLFGWKFTPSAAADGRSSYELTCQPPEDVNRNYIIFRDHAEAMDYVAGKLATLSYYSADTQAYQAAVTHGGDVPTAVKAWVAGISDPYNWKPEEYTQSIIRVMNNPAAPSDAVSPDTNLYKLSEQPSQPTTVPPATTAGSASDADIAYAASRIHPWNGSCDPNSIMNYARWSGFPVRLCSYEDIGVTTRVYMLNASRDRIARWLVTACHDANATNVHGCVNDLAEIIGNEASYSVFPVAGYIPEPQSGGRCFLFRDGVTVTTAGWPHQLAPVEGKCGPDSELDSPVVKARLYARIASTTREDYTAAGGQEQVDAQNGDPRWADVIRSLYQRAWTNERNELISAVAKREKKNHAFD